jgi:hemerythrin
MVENLATKNAEMKELNLHLEQKVHDRTRELEQAYTKLKIVSLTDVLTGLPNRRHAMENLQELWVESVATQKPLSCMMIDADYFKEVNDNHGHDAGDLVLRELSRTLKNEVRTDDMVCRLGGDEFLIICPDTALDGARYLAEQLVGKVKAMKIPTGDEFWHSSVSIGVAARSADMNNFDELIKMSDLSLYKAKEDGRGCARTLQQADLPVPSGN